MPEEELEDNTQQELLYATRSEEIQEIMGRMPSWIIRSGITVMAFIVLGLFVGAYFFKYPDVIPARVTISSGNPPVKIIARNSLPIQQLLVQNNQEVNKNEILCILANPAKYQEVEQIAAISHRLDTCMDLSKTVNSIVFPNTIHLGDLQSGYIALYQAISDYQFFLQHNSYNAKLNHLQEQVVYQEQYSDELNNKDKKMKAQLSIQQKRFHLDSSLVASTIMSKVEYENAQKELLDKEMTTSGNHTVILQSQLQQKEIETNISETEIQWQNDKNILEEKIRETAKQFNGALAQWEQNFVLRSPVSGVVTFFKFWKENQFVQSGEPVMIVTPPIDQFLARGEISINGAGKIKKGQKVLIKLLAYPYQEFGSVTGTVASRSAVAMDSTFSILINLPNGLKTNAAISIPPQAQMEGMAEILTDNKSILARLFENVYGKRRE